MRAWYRLVGLYIELIVRIRLCTFKSVMDALILSSELAIYGVTLRFGFMLLSPVIVQLQSVRMELFAPY